MAKTSLPVDMTTVPIFELQSATGATDTNKESTVLVWFDPKSGSRFDAQDVRKRLNHVINQITFYNERKRCISVVRSIVNQKIFMVTPGLYASDILSAVGNLPQIDCIFVLCTRKASYEYLSAVYPKIVGIYAEVDSLCTSIKEQIDRIDNDLQAFSFFDQDKRMTKHLSKELAEFLCFQLFKYVILHQPPSEQAKKQMIKFCRQCYQDSPTDGKLIDQFEQNYRSEEAIRWYSKQSFIYRMINNALRIRDINQLYIFRFFFADVSQNLAREHKKFLLNNKTMIFYRGVKLSNSELDKFKKNEGKLVSTNGFLLTSQDRSEALAFAKESTKRTDTNPTLIEIKCDVKKLGERVIFANLATFSELPNENGVLFDLNSVFQLETVRYEDDTWLIKMNATDKGPSITENYIKVMRLDTEKLSFPIMLGIVMCSMSEYNKSQQYFEKMLADPNGEDPASIEYHIGRALDLQKDWEGARKHYDQAYELMIKSEPKRIEDSTRVLNDIGNTLVYQEKDDEALEFFRKALAMQENYHTSGHASIAFTLNNIGSTLTYQGKYDEALELHRRALIIQEKFCPSDHVEISNTLTNIGTMLSYQEKYDEALEFHQRALKIKEKYYPSDDIKITTSYVGIGTVLLGQQKYNEAFEFFQRALEIQENYYHSGHIDTANTLNSMAAIHRAQEKYDEALDFLQ